MSFLKNRVVTLGRVPVNRGVGVLTVEQMRASDFTPYATDIPCSIQFDREGGRPLGNLPGDARTRGDWRICIWKSDGRRAGLRDGTIQQGDGASDDIGRRFQISQIEPTFLGWDIHVELLVM